jgi:hypothetical protein
VLSDLAPEASARGLAAAIVVNTGTNTSNGPVLIGDDRDFFHFAGQLVSVSAALRRQGFSKFIQNP